MSLCIILAEWIWFNAQSRLYKIIIACSSLSIFDVGESNSPFKSWSPSSITMKTCVSFSILTDSLTTVVISGCYLFSGSDSESIFSVGILYTSRVVEIMASDGKIMSKTLGVNEKLSIWSNFRRIINSLRTFLVISGLSWILSINFMATFSLLYRFTPAYTNPKDPCPINFLSL